MARQKEMTRAIDKEFEDADDTGVLDISGRNLRQFPAIPGDLLDYNYVFEAGGFHGGGRGWGVASPYLMPAMFA